MTDSNPNFSSEMAATRIPMSDHELDLAALLRQIRLCRSTLGAILEELDNSAENPAAFDQLAECTANVTAEIESLWEITKQPSKKCSQ